MKAYLLSSARGAALASLLLGATSMYASSSTGGAPGRSDVIKRREKAPAQKSVKQATDPSVSPAPSIPPETSSRTAPTRFVWITSPSAESPSARQEEAPEKASAALLSAVKSGSKHQSEIGLNYDEVLTIKQKAILQERAEALGLVPGDYSRLLTDDEKQRLDAMLVERRQRVTSDE